MSCFDFAPGVPALHMVLDMSDTHVEATVDLNTNTPGIDVRPWSYTCCYEFVQPIAGGDTFFAV